MKERLLRWVGRWWVLYLANAREFLRDRITLFLVVLLPVALAVFFGTIFGGNESFTQVGVVDMGEKSVQTRPLRAIDFHLAGFLGISMIWKGLFSTTASVGRLREKQVLRRLCLTPLAPMSFLGGHVAWSLTVGLMQAAVFLLVGCIAFGVRVAGSWALLVAMVVLGSLVSTGMGYCLASLFTSAEAGAVAIQIINFPLMMLSGSLFSTEMLPAYFKPLVAIMPLTYLSDGLRQLVVGASPMYPLWVDYAVLGGWLLLFMGMTIKFWRWE